MGMRIYSDVAIDDFSLSPECFGLNIPAEHLQGYNYYDQRILQDKTPHEDFVNRSSTFFFSIKHFDNRQIFDKYFQFIIIHIQSLFGFNEQFPSNFHSYRTVNV